MARCTIAVVMSGAGSVLLTQKLVLKLEKIGEGGEKSVQKVFYDF